MENVRVGATTQLLSAPHDGTLLRVALIGHRRCGAVELMARLQHPPHAASSFSAAALAPARPESVAALSPEIPPALPDTIIAAGVGGMPAPSAISPDLPAALPPARLPTDLEATKRALVGAGCAMTRLPYTVTKVGDARAGEGLGPRAREKAAEDTRSVYTVVLTWVLPETVYNTTDNQYALTRSLMLLTNDERIHVPRALVLVYRASDRETFEDLKRHHKGYNMTQHMLVVGLTDDKAPKDLEVPPWEGYAWAVDQGYTFISFGSSAEDSQTFLEALIAAHEENQLAHAKHEMLRTRGSYVPEESVSATGDAPDDERGLIEDQAPPPTRRTGVTSFYTRAFNFLFDLFQVVLSMLDVITDVGVAVQYYQEGHTTFGHICVADLILAQMVYTAFFVLVHAQYDTSYKRRFKAFIILLPFGQLIPLFVYLGSLNVNLFNRWFNRLGLEKHIYHGRNPMIDPLQEYLQKKLEAHMGFILESLVEAIPQSILQVVGIVVTGQITSLNVLSIFLSISSVGSKGLMMSYSIHRPTFAFSFCCIVFDVFALFSVATWVFLRSPYDKWATAHVFVSSQPTNVFSAIWMWKTLVFACICAFGGLLGLIKAFVAHRRRGEDNLYYAKPCCGLTASSIIELIIYTLAGIAFFLPLMIVAEGAKLVVIPIVFFNTMDSPHARDVFYFRRMFAFLNKGNFRERVFCVNRVHARATMRNRPNYLPVHNMDALTGLRFQVDQTLLEYCLNVSIRDMTLKDLRIAAGATLPSLLANWRALAVSERVRNGEWTQRLNNLLTSYGFYVMLPAWILSGLYSLIYPFLCLVTISPEVDARLQKILTYVLISIVALLLLLSKPVYRFRRSVFYAMTFHAYHTTTFAMDHIERVYARYQEMMRLEEQTRGMDGFPDPPLPTTRARIETAPPSVPPRADAIGFRAAPNAPIGGVNMVDYAIFDLTLRDLEDWKSRQYNLCTMTPESQPTIRNLYIAHKVDEVRAQGGDVATAMQELNAIRVSWPFG